MTTPVVVVVVVVVELFLKVKKKNRARVRHVAVFPFLVLGFVFVLSSSFFFYRRFDSCEISFHRIRLANCVVCRSCQNVGHSRHNELLISAIVLLFVGWAIETKRKIKENKVKKNVASAV